jgi:hypothetical protein
MQKRITVLILMLVAFALGVNAQSTYNHPWAGATHHYVATVTDPGNDNPVRWWVATDALGNTKAVYNTDYSFVTAGYNVGNDRLQGTAVYDVQITWGTADVAGTDYYIVFEVDDNSSGCTNRMTQQVQIEANFNALAWDVTGSATPGTVVIGGPGDDTDDPTCPDPVVNPLWDGDSHTDIGNSALVFRVNKANTLLNWQFEFDITEGTAQPFTIDSIRFVDDLGNLLTVANQTGDRTGGDVSVNSTENWVLAYVYIRNQMGVTLNINFDLITANNLTRDAGNNYDSLAPDNHADHTIQPMPVITNFGGN